MGLACRVELGRSGTIRWSRFCKILLPAWSGFESWGIRSKSGISSMQVAFPALRQQFNDGRDAAHRLPFLAGAGLSFGIRHRAARRLRDVARRADLYTYNRDWMSRDLSWYLGAGGRQQRRFSRHCILRISSCSRRQPGWPPGTSSAASIRSTQRDEWPSQSHDGLPVLLADWIERDGLSCLKIKLRGNDAAWDYQRIVRVGEIALEHGVGSSFGRLQLHGHRPSIRERHSGPIGERQPRLSTVAAVRRAAVRL